MTRTDVPSTATRNFPDLIGNGNLSETRRPASLMERSRLNSSRTDDAFYQDYLVQPRTPLNPRGLPRSNALPFA